MPAIPTKMPPFGITFLEGAPEEQDRIITIVEAIIEDMSMGARKKLLIDSHVPQHVIGTLRYSETLATHNVAVDVVMTLQKQGASGDTHIFGSFLAQLLEKYVWRDEEASASLVAIIFKYNLTRNRELIQRLSSRFQVPSPVLTTEAIDQLTLAPLPERLRPPNAEERLESLRSDGINRNLNAKFIIAAAKAILSVCRVEFKDIGEGTGFLVGSDLVLTNYHVLMPFWYTRKIEDRVKDCKVRFGAITNEKGGVEPGTLFELHDDWHVASSGRQELDYVLLRIQRPVEESDKVRPVFLQAEQIQQGAHANILQHPLSGPMEVSLRYNEVVAVEGKRVYYLADTQKGSSGAPVFNDNWQVIAMHHEGRDGSVPDANAGIPINLILTEIQAYL